MNLLYLVFFLTGSTALVFESLWFHQAGLALGNSVWASSAVLSAFMAGLALGNAGAARIGHRIQEPVRFYAFAELVIGLVGAVIVFGLPSLGLALAPVFRGIGVDSTVATNVLRFAAAFVLMLAPATMMGFTLPVLTRALSAADPSFGRVLGRLYGSNTLGAVVGVLLADVVLVPAFGVLTTALIATGLNGVAAVTVLAIDRRAESPPPEQLSAALEIRPIWRLAGAAFGAGLILLALEVVWFRVMVWFVPQSPSVFALMLAVVLLGIALGGLLGARFETALSKPGALVMLPLASAFSGLLGFELALWFLHQFPPVKLLAYHRIAGLALFLMLPTSFVSGVFFTALGARLRTFTRTAAEAAGILTLSNTLGAAIGSLLAGVLFLPLLGLEDALLTLSLLYIVVAAFLLPTEQRARTVAIALAVAAATAVLFPRGALERRIYDFDEDEVVARRDGMSESIAYVEHEVLGVPRDYRLVTNGHLMATNHHFARRYMEIFSFLPAALHPGVERALVISFGTGQTARSLTEIPTLKSLDIVDISADILELSDIVFTDLPHPLQDPRSSVHIEDGRFFLQQTDREFDLITAEPPPPAAAGVFALYSREYFQLARSRLAPGGMIAYWLPVHLATERSNLAIVRAFCDAFPTCTLWRGMNACLTLIAWREDVKFGDPATLFEDPVARERLHYVAIEKPAHLGALWIGGPEYLAEVTAGVEPVTDDFPHRIQHPIDEEWPIIASWMHDVDAAKQRFQDSELAVEALGRPLHEESLQYFEPTDALEDRLFANLSEKLRGPRTFEVRDVEVMLQHDMKVAAMWGMGSDVKTQRIFDNVSPERQAEPDAQLHLGVRHLLAGRYAEAAAAFERAQGEPKEKKRAEVLERYAKYKLGEHDDSVLDEPLPGKPQ